MSKNLQKRKSSSSQNRIKLSISNGRRSQTDSLKQETSLPLELSLRDDSTSTALVEEKSKKINYQDELVLIFFNNMLDNIVDEWITIPDVPPKPCVCTVDEQEKESIQVKDFKSVTEDELQVMEITNVEGSMVSLTKKRKLKKSTSQQSRSMTRQDSINKKRHSKSGEILDDTGGVQSKERSQVSSSTATSRSALPSCHLLDWILDLPDENVVIKFKNGNRYEGPVHRKAMHGYGKFYWADGSIYEGEFIHGDATGKGKLIYPDLTSYSGNFCKSFLHGDGVFSICSLPMIYSGEWKGGQKHGRGWVLYEPGNWYEGEWFEDKRQGVGFRQYKSGERYKGQWYQGEKHGQGTCVWPNNDVYKGDWVNGIMNGYGEYAWNSFLNETFTFPLEHMYRGSWVNGMRDGVGIMFFGIDGGARLVGMWECNKKHGPGIVVCGNGTTIERNPLFWDDKPIDLETELNQGYANKTAMGSLQRSQDVFKTISFEDRAAIGSNLEKSALQVLAKRLSMQSSVSEFSCDEGLGCKTCHVKETTKKMEIKTSLVKNRPEFPTGRPECSPLFIPIHLAPELIDFTYFTNLAVEKYTAQLYKNEIMIVRDKDVEDFPACGGIKSSVFPSTVLKYSKWNELAQTNSDQPNSKTLPTSKCNVTQSNFEIDSRTTSYRKIQAQVEEKHLRNTIIAHLTQLKSIYNKYATITSPHPVPFKPKLIRYFLWQMLRDWNISREYTLVDIDLILLNISGIGLESEHYPFERIYFWQFLQILLTLAWTLHSPSVVTEDCKLCGILSTICIKFFNEVVYKNVPFSSARSLFEYRNLLPIYSVYSLYQRIGEPHTARKFLCSACTKKNQEPPCYLKIFEDDKSPELPKGVNVVAFGGNIIFLPDDPPGIGENPDEFKVNPPAFDPYCKELFVLRSLKPRKVVECLISVCPQIVENDVIVNMDHPLSFIEFYETLLSCAFIIVDRDKKHKETIKLIEERRLAYESAGEVTEETDQSNKSGRNVKDKKIKNKR